MCLVCRCSAASWPTIAGKTCPRSAAERWARLAAADVAAGEEIGRGHTRWLSDDTIWCSTCGQYATHAAVGLKRACHPIKAGTRFKRRLLAAGVHPWTRVPFASAAIPEHDWQDPASLVFLAAPGRPLAPPPQPGTLRRLRRGLSPACSPGSGKRQASAASLLRLGSLPDVLSPRRCPRLVRVRKRQADTAASPPRRTRQLRAAPRRLALCTLWTVLPPSSRRLRVFRPPRLQPGYVRGSARLLRASPPPWRLGPARRIRLVSPQPLAARRALGLLRPRRPPPSLRTRPVLPRAAVRGRPKPHTPSSAVPPPASRVASLVLSGVLAPPPELDEVPGDPSMPLRSVRGSPLLCASSPRYSSAATALAIAGSPLRRCTATRGHVVLYASDSVGTCPSRISAPLA